MSNRKTVQINNFLVYLIVGLVPLILLPRRGHLSASIPKLIVLGVIGIVFLLHWFIRRREMTVIRDNLENRFLAGYVFFLLVSMFFSLDPVTSFWGSGYRYDGLVAFFLYLLAYLAAKNGHHLGRKLFWILAVSGFLVALLGVLQFYSIDPIPSRWYAIPWKDAAFATMGNPNFLGSYLVLVIPMPLYLYFYKNQPVGLIFYSVMVLALLCTRTRGAWIGFFISLLVFLFLHHKGYGFRKKEGRKVLVVFLLTLVISGFFIITSGDLFFARFLSIFGDLFAWIKQTEGSEMGGSFRIYLWGKVLTLIGKRPLTGYGIDVLYIAMNSNFREQIIQDFGVYKNWDKAHNEFLNIAVSSGVLSLLAYLGFVGAVIRRAYKRLPEHPGYVALLAAVMGYLVQAMFNIQVVMVYYVFFAYLGILSAEEGLEDTRGIFSGFRKTV